MIQVIVFNTLNQNSEPKTNPDSEPTPNKKKKKSFLRQLGSGLYEAGKFAKDLIIANAGQELLEKVQGGPHGLRLHTILEKDDEPQQKPQPQQKTQQKPQSQPQKKAAPRQGAPPQKNPKGSQKNPKRSTNHKRSQKNPKGSKRSKKKAPKKYCTGKDIIITMEVDTNGRVEILGIKEKK